MLGEPFFSFLLIFFYCNRPGKVVMFFVRLFIYNFFHFNF